MPNLERWGTEASAESLGKRGGIGEQARERHAPPHSRSAQPSPSRYRFRTLATMSGRKSCAMRFGLYLTSSTRWLRGCFPRGDEYG